MATDIVRDIGSTHVSITDLVHDVVYDAGLTVTPAAATISDVDTTVQLSAFVPQAGSMQDVTALATWVSSDPTKATVSATGLVTRVADGSTTVTATFQGYSGQSVITVTTA